ncbi:MULTISPECIES: hypothetical protein [Paenibacillus]|uniref:Type III secretory pathway component EscR n=1 Tax=Paenibacillus silagei TaxID=1670801 RepID=A0ABS4NT98_9BACL|nr:MULTISPECIES: hypothetical protein [Paenibacillus]ETT72463.1 hypothetical protein C173_14015 [Paenibacillus sp. FSL R7-277]MBP2113288.1 type III secretory pathway component EscR [Paenibacillus silagei]
MKAKRNIALILSFIALTGGMFISSLIGVVFGIISIALSLQQMKADRKKSLIAIIISTIAMLIPIILAVTLATILDE